MARWATLVEIAGVEYTGCRAILQDGEDFFSPFTGSADWGNDGTVHVQLVDRGVKGIVFSINMLSTEQSKLEDTLTAIQTAQNTNTTFVVKINDGIHSVNVNAVPDYTQPKWLSLGKHSEGWYEDVTFRFISKSQGA